MSAQANSSAHRGSGHVVSIKVLVATWLVLLVLTGVTVLVAQIDLGRANIVAALGIASLKATVVALIFMHLKYEGRFKTVVFVSSVLFAVIFTGFILFDTTQYQEDIRDYETTRAAKPAPGEKPAAPPEPQ
jgi:cytochrome c oxidase subunit 4